MSLSHLSLRKQKELRSTAVIIRAMAPVEMIILFGGHAPGKQVEKIYQRDGVVYKYKSGFDVLVVTEDKLTANNTLLWDRVADRLNRPGRTPITLLQYSIDDLNLKIGQRYPFFVDIKKHGIALYDSNRFKLAKGEELMPEQRYNAAKENLKICFKDSREFYFGFKVYVARRNYKIAAFLLHQAAEKLYHAILLVFTGYQPKLHELDKLWKFTIGYSPLLLSIFPRNTIEEKHLFNKLKNAYVDARYKQTYRISKGQLEELSRRIFSLRLLTGKICQEKIASFRCGPEVPLVDCSNVSANPKPSVKIPKIVDNHGSFTRR